MTLKAAILAWLLTLPASWHTRDLETPVQRRARLEVVAVAVSETAAASKWLPPKQAAAAVLAVWQKESAFDVIVHSGAGPHPVWTQDGGRSRCAGQIHRSAVPRKLWLSLTGLDAKSTKACSDTTLLLLRRQSYCTRLPGTWNDKWARVFSAYGSGAGCRTTAKGLAKLSEYGRVLTVLRRQHP